MRSRPTGKEASRVTDGEEANHAEPGDILVMSWPGMEGGWKGEGRSRRVGDGGQERCADGVGRDTRGGGERGFDAGVLPVLQAWRLAPTVMWSFHTFGRAVGFL